jgi:hypothetical protein
MTSPENIGQQFLYLYRGLSTPKFEPEDSDQVDFDNLGVHWTPNRNVAQRFATQEVPYEGDNEDLQDVFSTGGRVIRAKVRVKDIVDPNSEEGKELSDKLGIFNRTTDDSDEKEHTVRPGAKVKIKGVSEVWSINGIPQKGDDLEHPKKGRA